MIKAGSNVRSLSAYLLTGALACAVIVILESINGRFRADDFTVYYMAAKSLVMGGQPYGTIFGHSTVGAFKYSPFALIMFVPLTLFPLKTAITINYIVLSVTLLLVIPLASRIIMDQVFRNESPLKGYLLLLVFLSALIHIIRELLLGNINLPLLMLVCLGLNTQLRSRPYFSGFFYGMAISFKPYFLLLALPLLAHRKYGVLAGLAGSLAVFFLLPSFISGWAGDLGLHRDWINSIVTHNEVMVSHQTLAALAHHYFNMSAGLWLDYLFIGLAGVVYIAYRLATEIRQRKTGKASFNPGSIVMETFILLALLPNLVVTDIQHFLLAIPLLVFLILYIRSHLKWQLVLTYAVLIFLYAGNSMDLLGREASNWLLASGFTGIGNLLIVVFTMYLLVQLKMDPKKQYN